MDRIRQITPRCRSCRREDYFSKRYQTICMQCNHYRPLDTNDVCRGCNADNGVRQCKGVCSAILPILLSFERKRTICKDCRAATLTTARAMLLQAPSSSA